MRNDDDRDEWDEAERRVNRTAMPCGREKRQAAASKETWRSKRRANQVGKESTGIRKRRIKRWD